MRRFARLIFLAAVASPLTAGDLTPPAGPRAPTMKTLDQIEARIPINQDTAPGDANYAHVISAPGSYYLTGNIALTVSGVANGILIAAERVTLDLNGFSLTGLGFFTGSGISFSTESFPDSIAIRNGTIQLFDIGVLGSADGAVIEDVRLLNCTAGVHMADQTYGVRIDRCEFLYMGAGARVGQTARVSDCVFRSVGQAVVVSNGAVISDCIVAGSATGFTGAAVLVKGCNIVNASTPYNLTGASAVFDSIPASP